MRLEGLTLQLSYERASARWRLSDGAQVRPAVAALVVADARVVGVGDALFSGFASQTYRFASEEKEAGLDAQSLKPKRRDPWTKQSV
jgi:hypothetical protein